MENFKNERVLFYRNRAIGDPLPEIRNTGMLPFLLDDASEYYLAGDGTWQKLEAPIVEHEDVHTDTGYYE